MTSEPTQPPIHEVREEPALPEPPPIETPIELPPLDEAPVVRSLIPTRSLPLLLLLLACGSLVVIFASLTIHRRSGEELRADLMAQRMEFTISHWLKHGYFASGGMAARPWPKPPGYHFHRSSTGGRMIPGFLVEKVFSTFTGRYSWRLLALHNQLVMLLVSALFALLGFRLATRFGLAPHHAFTLAVSLLIVNFTFPDNLAIFWGTTGREWILAFAFIFLLLEERAWRENGPGRTRAITILQALCAFAVTYVGYVEGGAFLVSYAVATLVLTGGGKATVKRLLLTCALPVIAALAIYGAQLRYVRVAYPDVPVYGSAFLFRTGLDGSTEYYGDHLDIAYRRDVARSNFAKNGEFLFKWRWLFFAGVTAFVIALIGAMRGRVPTLSVLAVLSLLGSYLLTATVFSQAVVIHPYLYDVLLFTPLVLALFIVTPSLVEMSATQRGVVVAAVFFLAMWVAAGQMRRFAIQYPPKPKPAKTADASIAVTMRGPCRS